MMSTQEIRSAIEFGKQTIESYKAGRETVPAWVYERMIELYEQLVENEYLGL